MENKSKLIIVEGLDRCLKNTIIDDLKRIVFKNDIIHTLHYSKPPMLSNMQEIKDYQLNIYKDFFKINDFLLNSDNRVIISNRSYIGEMVYGELYRNYFSFINLNFYEKEFLFKNKNVYLILLYDTNLQYLKQRDDNNSLWKSNSSNFDNNINNEIELFQKYFALSNIPNKIEIDLNNYYFENSNLIKKDKILNKIQNRFLF